MMEWIAVAGTAAWGAVLRFLVELWIAEDASELLRLLLPPAIVVNAMGCLAMGFLHASPLLHALPAESPAPATASAPDSNAAAPKFTSSSFSSSFSSSSSGEEEVAVEEAPPAQKETADLPAQSADAGQSSAAEPTAASEHVHHHRWRLPPEITRGVATGFLGSLTTFSSWAVGCAHVANREGILPFAWVAAAGLAVPYAAFRLGSFAARVIRFVPPATWFAVPMRQGAPRWLAVPLLAAGMAGGTVALAVACFYVLGASAMWTAALAPGGALLRFSLARLLNGRSIFGFAIPYGTLAANAMGTVLDAVLFEWASPASSSLGSPFVVGLETGFCGGLTTMSTLVREVAAMIEHPRDLAVYVFLTATTVLAATIPIWQPWQ